MSSKTSKMSALNCRHSQQCARVGGREDRADMQCTYLIANCRLVVVVVNLNLAAFLDLPVLHNLDVPIRRVDPLKKDAHYGE